MTQLPKLIKIIRMKQKKKEDDKMIEELLKSTMSIKNINKNVMLGSK